MIEEEVSKRINADGTLDLKLYAEKNDVYKYVGYDGKVTVDGNVPTRNGLFSDFDTL